MEGEAEQALLSTLQGLSTAKDKIFEISRIMIAFQKSSAREMVNTWLREFINYKDDKKKLALLYVMNDVMLKSSSENRGEEYLHEFSQIMDDIIAHLTEARLDSILEEMRRIVMVWEEPKTSIFVPQYTARLRAQIHDAVNQVLDDKSGASVIHNFEMTQMLASIEGRNENIRNLSKRLDHICAMLDHPQQKDRWNFTDSKQLLEDFRGKCEQEILERTKALMYLSSLVQEEYGKYANFVDVIKQFD